MTAHLPLSASTRCILCDVETDRLDELAEVAICEDCDEQLEAELSIEAAWMEHEDAVLADGWRAAIRDLYLPVREPVVLRKLA